MSRNWIALDEFSGEIVVSAVGKIDIQMMKNAMQARSPHGVYVYGGSGEIRTHGCRKTSPVFKTGAFNRSATLPWVWSLPEGRTTSCGAPTPARPQGGTEQMQKPLRVKQNQSSPSKRQDQEHRDKPGDCARRAPRFPRNGYRDRSPHRIPLRPGPGPSPDLPPANPSA